MGPTDNMNMDDLLDKLLMMLDSQLISKYPPIRYTKHVLLVLLDPILHCHLISD